MGVTYFIGNGFDLSMGLRTGYRDFLRAYLRNRLPAAEPRTAQEARAVWWGKWMIRLRLRRSDVNWSDMEEALGQYTRYYRDTPSSRAAFEALRHDIESSLSAYLIAESRKKSGGLIKPEHYAQVFAAFDRVLKNPLQFLDPGGQRLEGDSVANGAQAPLRCHFISFNYTTVFDDCLNVYRAAIDASQGGAEPPPMTVDAVFHAHGLAERAMIFGVSNYDQIDNSALRGKDFADGLIKPRLCESNHNHAEETVLRALRGSRLLVVIGMSVGVTDIHWWEIVGQWLMRSPDNHMIIHYGKPGLHIELGDTAAKVRAMIECTLRRAIGDGRYVDIADRVHITLNQFSFGFRLVDAPPEGRLKRVWKRLRGW
jgi:hypothetical protein